MGCDVHCFTETFSPITREWSIATEPDPYYTPPAERLTKTRTFKHYPQRSLDELLGRAPATELADPVPFTEDEALAAAEDPEEWPERPTRLVKGYADRNYGLFAILADVRNGKGFAGCEIGERTVPIDQPRGVPTDASRQYREEVESWGHDGHSHTWFTLPELLAYDWDGHHSVNSMFAHPNGHFAGRESTPTGYDFDAFAVELELVLNVQGEDAASERWPTLGFCGGISGGNEYEWRRVKWKVTHRQQAGAAWFEYLEQLKAEADAAGRPYEFTRIVLFFDN